VVDAHHKPACDRATAGFARRPNVRLSTAARRAGLHLFRQESKLTLRLERKVGAGMSSIRVAVLALCFAAGAAWADAQQTDQQKQAASKSGATGKAGNEPREMKTLQLGNGSYIRYEVLPDDDQQPPGQLVVMHFDTPKPAPAPSEAEEQAASDEEAATRARAAVRNSQRRRTACDDLRGQLAARLLELRGVQADPDVALWIQRNLYFAADGTPALQFVPDPLFFSAIQSDFVARGIATDLAHCEQAAHR
jgi:hypothetical protein